MREAKDTSGEVVCFGEVLWDSLPEGLFLGGAPLNVAAHLSRLGVAATIVTAVGDDVLGREAVRRMAGLGVSTDLVQTRQGVQTGFVDVELRQGSPTYVIRQPAAWDDVMCDEQLLARVSESRALVFGTLSQRAPQTRTTLESLWHAAPNLIVDVNLRPPFDHREAVEASLEYANIVKLSSEELIQICAWHDWRGSDWDRCARLADRFDVSTVVLTRGAGGAAVLHDGRFSEEIGPTVDVVDTVGAGDAFLAGFLWVLFCSEADEVERVGLAIRLANQLGGFVASRSGAIPPYGPEDVARLRRASER